MKSKVHVIDGVTYVEVERRRRSAIRLLLVIYDLNDWETCTTESVYCYESL
jgi:hypothetical protein